MSLRQEQLLGPTVDFGRYVTLLSGFRALQNAG